MSGEQIMLTDPDGTSEPGTVAADTAAPGAERIPDHDLPGALEAVLLIAEEPISESALAVAVGHGVGRVRAELGALAERYTTGGSGIDVRDCGSGWRLYTRDRFAHVVEKFLIDGVQSRLSKAALETLAVVAYRQPVTRARIAAVRGVNVDGVIRTLTARGLIEETGSDPDSGALLYRTTDLFLDRMGLSELTELPSLGPLLPDADSIDDLPRESAQRRRRERATGGPETVGSTDV